MSIKLARNQETVSILRNASLYFIRMNNCLAVFVLTFMLCLSCSPKLEMLDSSVNELLSKAEVYQGGRKNFHKLKTISYTKRFVLYHSDGKEERVVTQYHNYDFTREKYSITSVQDGKTTVQIAQVDEILEWGQKGSIKEGAHSDFWKSLNATLFVYRLPFNLRDSGVELSLHGRQEVRGRETRILQANYNPSKFENHSTADKWFFMIADNGEILANKIYTSDHNSWVDNLSWQEVGGLRLYKHRKSYRLDEKDEKTYLRAEYWYEDFIVE